MEYSLQILFNTMQNSTKRHVGQLCDDSLQLLLWGQRLFF
jgi:hypothetical protein